MRILVIISFQIEEKQSGVNKLSFNKEVKKEDKYEFNESISSSKSNKQEKGDHHEQFAN